MLLPRKQAVLPNRKPGYALITPGQKSVKLQENLNFGTLKEGQKVKQCWIYYYGDKRYYRLRVAESKPNHKYFPRSG